VDAMYFISEEYIFLFLVQLCVLLSLAKFLGYLVNRWGWPVLVGEILCGILLGPTILGRILPSWHHTLFPADMVQQNMLETISWVGVLFLLLVTGFEVRLSSVWKQGKTAVTVGSVGVIIPIIIGFVVFYWLPASYRGPESNRLIFTLLLSTAAAISAIPVIAKILYDMDILKSDLGLTTLSAFVVNDILGWLIFTLVLGFAGTTSQLYDTTPLRVFFEIILFGTICLTIGSKLVGRMAKAIKQSILPQTATILTFITILASLCGIITQWIGVHAILGFFVAGIMAGNTEEISEHTREIISRMVHAIFVPIFFVSIGLKIDFIAHFDLVLVLLFTMVAIMGKFIGAWFGGYISKMEGNDAIAIGIAHIPGGAMEIIIGMLAFELGLISNSAYVAIVVAAIFSSMAVGPLLAGFLKRREYKDIGSYVAKEVIEIDLAVETRWQAIRALVDKVVQHNQNLNKKEVIAAVEKREKSMGTSVGLGTAVPHARITGLKSPIIAFGRSKLGLDWDAPDGYPTRLIFLILTPSEDNGAQVQILSAIARYMMQPNIQTEIMSVENTESMYQMLRQGLKPPTSKG